MERSSRHEAARIAFLYLLFGVAWIFATDLLVEELVSGEAAMRQAQTLKGWLFVAAGTVLLFLLIRRYSSQRESALQAARAREERLNRAQEIARLGSWEYDFLTEELHWSDEVYEIFGVERGDFEPSREAFYGFVHPEDLAEQKRADRTVLEGPAPLDNEHRIVRRDGEIRYVHERAVLERDDRGRPARLRGTVQDITERKRLERELERSRDLLRSYARRLMRERENERDALARDIHDHLGQLLTAVKIQLDQQLRGDASVDRERLRESIELIHQGIQEVRDISTALRPPDLDQLGLVEALAASVDRFEERTGIPCSFETKMDRVPLDREESTHAYRIVQEALTNVARHAGAERARVRLEKLEEGFVLRVLDDGVGFGDGVDRHRESHGIVGMRERARLLDGEFEIRSRDGGGAEVRVRVPAPVGGT